ncbi:chromosome partitioning protein ParA [Vibrio ostreicida]|uniref:Chromosome partitioning protein ParA n=1 Tax=Vibrio ostreicida TaxID=526588 RepID=A0ABT8BSS3_9VIBR|nr:chromosome partitioning protein ParA [Vibrio ostreicida]MDN3609822.1 chromosome partitioning protein ParA [Vibrio ostreicida]NPD09357.1 chromosome partitioning protein ParA [Vibrio ostreicida]
MSNEPNLESNEDVVVIEERDKRSYIYILIASALGLALGGLIGSFMTTGKWQNAYSALESKYQMLIEQKQQMAQEFEDKALIAKADGATVLELQQLIKIQKEKHQAVLADIHAQVTELEKVNMSLEEQVTQQKQQIDKASKENGQLNRQADMQVTMFERSREIFQQELKVKQELESLTKEREALVPKISSLKEECDLYLEGKSWDARSNACDLQDESNSRLSQVNQMIRVHQMDLKQMKALSKELGL